jgi:hypothetical protein
MERICMRGLICALVAAALVAPVALAQERSWTGDIGGVGPDYAVTVLLSDGGMDRELLTVNATNTGTVPWGDCHFGIFDPVGGQNIAGVDFLDASMGGEDPTSTQTGLTWIINNDVVGATIDIFFCSDPVLPGQTASFTVYLVNPDHIFYGVSFYPTPVPPDGACCNPDGSCTLTCSHECFPPSIWHGEWTSCMPNPCPQPLGACCFTDGRCEMLDEATCLGAPDHVQWIADGTCTPSNPCEQPGACCDPATGACTFVLAQFCLPPLEFHPDWVCTPVNPCPPPVPARGTTWGQIKATYR